MPTSAATTVFTNAAGTLLAHPAGYAEVRYAPTPLRIADLQPLLTQLGQLLLQRGWYRILLDGRQLKPLSDAVKQWTQANWTAAGIARPAHLELATLLPTDVFSRLGVQELQLGTTNGNRSRNFSDEAAAHAYLTSLPS
ncbi:hypothetical protein HHL22_09895 [Hymenobacter sp. RP-2-7]|uniref:STAS/SEC14 domain-containing protein n=1 Tax=Hymenobacter polaris TaxID=2682546 RepID=A0A7Y0ADU5_9BACT|nr:hypothetical protein [Hymenobacter polaris]NML65515.1 hypothetical protein [Hymenobacter polaris]